MNTILFPQKSLRNPDTSLIKLIAAIAMIIDHIGAAVFPQYKFLRYIGRLAFPIYAYSIAAGCIYTKDPIKYLGRLACVALISQPIYAVAMNHMTAGMQNLDFKAAPFTSALTFYIESWKGKPSILFSLLLSTAMLTAFRKKQFFLALGIFLYCYMNEGKLDYGLNGVILVLLFYFTSGMEWYAALPVMAAFMIFEMGAPNLVLTPVFRFSYKIQLFAVFALIPIFMHSKSKVKLPKWFFYAYYPGHLLIILLLKNLIV